MSQATLTNNTTSQKLTGQFINDMFDGTFAFQIDGTTESNIFRYDDWTVVKAIELPTRDNAIVSLKETSGDFDYDFYWYSPYLHEWVEDDGTLRTSDVLREMANAAFEFNVVFEGTGLIDP